MFPFPQPTTQEDSLAFEKCHKMSNINLLTELLSASLPLHWNTENGSHFTCWSLLIVFLFEWQHKCCVLCLCLKNSFKRVFIPNKSLATSTFSFIHIPGILCDIVNGWMYIQINKVPTVNIWWVGVQWKMSPFFLIIHRMQNTMVADATFLALRFVLHTKQPPAQKFHWSHAQYFWHYLWLLGGIYWCFQCISSVKWVVEFPYKVHEQQCTTLHFPSSEVSPLLLLVISMYLWWGQSSVV